MYLKVNLQILLFLFHWSVGNPYNLNHGFNTVFHMTCTTPSRNQYTPACKALPSSISPMAEIPKHVYQLENESPQPLSPQPLSPQPSSSSSSPSTSSLPSLAEGENLLYEPVTIESLRRRYGHRKSVLGDWSLKETRKFYQLHTKSLQVDTSLGSLEERARIAAEARIALRLYARERCHVHGRIFAEIYDGIRHVNVYGYWSSNGMRWEEIKLKYTQEAERTLGPNSSPELKTIYMCERILDKASSTNSVVDQLNDPGAIRRALLGILSNHVENTKRLRWARGRKEGFPLPNNLLSKNDIPIVVRSALDMAVMEIESKSSTKGSGSRTTDT
jgi:hypothetical protein